MDWGSDLKQQSATGQTSQYLVHYYTRRRGEDFILLLNFLKSFIISYNFFTHIFYFSPSEDPGRNFNAEREQIPIYGVPCSCNEE